MPIKALKIAAFILLDLFILAVIIISPIAKYVIEKYDVQWLGREVSVNTCLVNPFTGAIWVSGLKVYEQNSDSLFFDAASVSANFDLLKMATSDTYEISSMTIYRPTARIVQHEKQLNFSDLIQKFSRDSLDPEPEKTVQFNLLNFKIRNGKFHYTDDVAPIHFYAKDFDISCPGLLWDNDTVALNYTFTSGGKNGTVAGRTLIDMSNLNYLFAVNVDNYDLGILNQYLHDITNEGEFRSQLQANVITTGNFQCADSVKATGTLAFKDFHFGKNKDEDFASIAKLSISAKLLNPNELIYDFDSIIVDKPFLKYELYENLDNIQLLFGEGGSKVAAVNGNPKKFNLIIEIVRLVEQLARNVLRSDYKLDRFAVYDGDFEFEDYSIADKFFAAAMPFHLHADSIYNNRKLVKLEINSGIQPKGSLQMNVSLDPNDSSYFDMKYQLKNIPITMFNPYVVNYTRFKFDSGQLNVTGDWKVRNGNINSENHVVLNNPGVTKRSPSLKQGRTEKNKEAKWIPVPLLVSLAKQKGNVIDYEIPIKGSFNDPNFNVWNIVKDVLKNVLMKPVRVLPWEKGKAVFRTTKTK